MAPLLSPKTGGPNQAPSASPGAPQSQAAALPFPIASRRMTRLSFSIPTTTLAAATATPLNPIQIPAVGYLSHINLEVSIVTVGASTVTADGPFNILQNVEFRTAAGNDLIVPLTGYQLYLINKYGAQFAQPPMSDAKATNQFAQVTPGTLHFFLQIPLEIDPSQAFGAIPALASNRSYQLAITGAGISTTFTGGPTATLQINGTAYFWSEPVAQTQSGLVQATEPAGLGSYSQWQLETPAVTPGDKYIKSNNVGNTLRTLIFTLRNSSGVRIGAATDWPAVSELYLDNEPMFYFTRNEWLDLMAKWYSFNVTTFDTVNGLDTGVYVIPFFALASNFAGVTESRAQYLPTLDSSQLQLRGTSYGAAASVLEIITQSIVPTSSSVLYGRLS